MDKHAALAQLVALRRSEEHETFFVLHRFDDGAWDFDYVVPWTKSAQNVDAKLMIIGQDWASEDFLRNPKNNEPDRVALRKHLGQDPCLATNQNIKRWLNFFDIKWEQTYATDVSIFIKPEKMTAKVPMAVLERCARRYTVPQLMIVKPVMVICLGSNTFNAVRRALGEAPMRLRDALRPNAHTTVEGTEIYGVPHAGGLGLAAYGGYAQVEPIWQQLAARFRQLNA
jgi:restriction system protein